MAYRSADQDKVKLNFKQERGLPSRIKVVQLCSRIDSEPSIFWSRGRLVTWVLGI